MSIKFMLCTTFFVLGFMNEVCLGSRVPLTFPNCSITWSLRLPLKYTKLWLLDDPTDHSKYIVPSSEDNGTTVIKYEGPEVSAPYYMWSSMNVVREVTHGPIPNLLITILNNNTITANNATSGDIVLSMYLPTWHPYKVTIRDDAVVWFDFDSMQYTGYMTYPPWPSCSTEIFS